MKAFLFGIILFAAHLCCFAQSQTTIDGLELIKNGYVVAGVKSLQKADASANDIWSQFFLGQCFEYGYGVDVDYIQAFRYYKKSAERGLAIAQNSYASCYERGIGTNKNAGKSQYWKKKSEGKFNEKDITLIYELYSEGLKHPENYAVMPNSGNDGTMLAMQNNGNINSNNTVANNNQTINNITIIQAAAPTQSTTQPTSNKEPEKPKSDVDKDIPTTNSSNENTFAVIVANENYQDVAKVPNALNDGEIFAKYCIHMIGIPATNVTLVKDATLNNLKREIGKLSKIADAFKGSAKIIFYYAGHGIPDEATKDAFLLPVDGYGTDTSTGYSLNELYSTLGKMPTEQIVVMLDACFSGTQRGEGMLASARGVAIKAKPNKAEGKMVILSAAQGDETAYPYEEQGHGLFTYYLLKKLKESQGNVSLGELATYIKDNVSKKSIVVNGKSQTPSINPSASLGESWKNWTLK